MPQRARINSQGQVVLAEPGLEHCCLPAGCPRRLEAPIHPEDPGDAVKIVCSNPACSEARFMHLQCFSGFESHVLTYLRGAGRARGWSDKQRAHNLWRKQGYDLCYKACGCRCGRGHIRKDLDYVSSAPGEQPRKPRRRGGRGQGGKHHQQQQQQQKVERSAPVSMRGGRSSPGDVITRQTSRDSQEDGELRVRTASFSSTGSSSSSGGSVTSSSPASSASSPSTPGVKTGRFDFFATQEQAAKGNIFKRREDFSSFSSLPSNKQNPYDIKMEDDGPYGNDEIRCFLLTELSKQEVVSVSCAVCNLSLPVFDRYPLVDGTFFLSPCRYNSDLQLTHDNKTQFLNSVCLGCMEGRRSDIRCLSCKTPWNGACLQKGTMYSYDIFASTPCCAHRTNCKNCRRPLFDPQSTQAFFSNYSREMTCPHCRSSDTHLVKPLTQVFYIRPYINQSRAHALFERGPDTCARALAAQDMSFSLPVRAPPGLQLRLF